MSGFLDEMAAGSEARWRQAASAESLEALRTRALATLPPVPPALSAFDLIAEVKLVAPSAGRLAAPPPDRAGFVAAQARRYAEAGAAVISVLSEPSRFEGRLDDVEVAAATVRDFAVPVLRKDFLVHPYQVWEARAVGAGGVLLIVRMLDGDRLRAMVDAAAESGLFVLLEAFDAADVARAEGVVRSWSAGAPPLFLGVNTRDLSTLRVDPDRLASLSAVLPPAVRCVAESGLETAADAARVADLGYTLALVGSALMRSDDPGALVAAMIAAGREARG